MKNPTYDLLIIGGGGAGLCAALEAAKNKDLICAVISKLHPLRSQTCMAQGGINAALNNNRKNGEDSVKNHILDTIKGGDYLCDQDAVTFFCENAPKAVYELEKIGLLFSRNNNGDIAQRPFGGGMFPRTCYCRDYTGHMLLNALYGEVLRNGMKVFDEWFVYELIVENSIFKGAVVLDIKTGEINTIKANAVVIATGGCGRLFGVSSNSLVTTGDGMALAYNSGCELKNTEFVQFHPTCFAENGFLVTEACRGEGGYLLNKNGERFMKNYDSQNMELSSRDIVSRAIETEIEEGRGINGFVYLDLTHLDDQIIYSRLSQVYNYFIQSHGLDCTKMPIPVRPAAHYFMGGIKTDVSCKTSIKGIFAAGECACNGIHGANRLGGNSLAEAVIFGKVAGKIATKYVENADLSDINRNYTEKAKAAINELKKRDNGIRYTTIKEKLQNTMQKYAGIFRSGENLKKALLAIHNLKDQYKTVTINCSEKSFNYPLIEALELKNMLDISEIILKSALRREESRGSHFRTDFPKKDNGKFLTHSIAVKSGDMKPEISYSNVTVTDYPPPNE